MNLYQLPEIEDPSKDDQFLRDWWEPWEKDYIKKRDMQIVKLVLDRAISMASAYEPDFVGPIERALKEMTFTHE